MVDAVEKNNEEIEDGIVQDFLVFAQKHGCPPETLTKFLVMRLGVEEDVPENRDLPLSHIIGTCLPGIDLSGFMESWTTGFHKLEEFKIEKVGEDLEFKVKAPGLSAAVVITVKKPKE